MTDYMQVAVNAAKSKVHADQRDREPTEDTEREHAAGVIRGERINTIARMVAWELHARGRLGTLSHVELQQQLTGVLAEVMYPGLEVQL